MSSINRWLDTNGLQLAAEKTEMAILVGRRKLRELKVKVAETDITTRGAIKVPRSSTGQKYDYEKTHKKDRRKSG